jgi:hypothetical protein
MKQNTCAGCEGSYPQLLFFRMPDYFKRYVYRTKRRKRTKAGSVALRYNGHYLCRNCLWIVVTDMFALISEMDSYSFRRCFVERDFISDLAKEVRQ